MPADQPNDLLDVVIVGFDVDDDGTILAGLGRVFKMDEARGRKLLDNLPSTIARGVPVVRARYLTRALGMIDARVEVRDPEGNVIELPVEPQPQPKPAPKPAKRAAPPKPQPKPKPKATTERAPAPSSPPAPELPAPGLPETPAAAPADAMPSDAPPSVSPPVVPPPAAPSPPATTPATLGEPTMVSAPGHGQPAAVRGDDLARPRASRTTLAEGQPLPPVVSAQLAATERPPPLAAEPETTPVLLGELPAPSAPEAPIPAPTLPNSLDTDADADAGGDLAGAASKSESMVGAWGGLSTKDPSYISAAPGGPPAPPTPAPDDPAASAGGKDAEPRFDALVLGGDAAADDAMKPDPLALTAPQPSARPEAGADALALMVPKPGGRPKADPLALTAPQSAADPFKRPLDPLALTAPNPAGGAPGHADAKPLGIDPMTASEVAVLTRDEAGLAITAPLEKVRDPSLAGKDLAASFKDFIKRDHDEAPVRVGKPNDAPPGFTHGGLDAPGGGVAARAGATPVEGADGNLALGVDGDGDRISLAPRDDTGVSLPGKRPMEVLTDYEQPSSESVQGYRHPVGRSGDIPAGDSPLAPAAHPGYREVERSAHDTRPFWATMGEGMMLPFMGSGTGWIIAISAWSAVVGGVSILFDVIPGMLGAIVGAALTVWLSGSVVAFAADYYRTCVWAVLGHHEAPSEKPSLEHLYGEYLGNSLQYVAFGIIGFLPLIAWSALQAWDDAASMRAFVTSPVTLLLLAAPSAYFPMALATAALGNRPSAIWHIGFGVSALMRAPLEYAFILLISMGASVFAATGFVIVGALLEMQGWFFLAALGFPMAIGCGIQGGLMGHLMRAQPETFGE